MVRIMRSLDVCKKCKWLQVSIVCTNFSRCDVDCVKGDLNTLPFDSTFHTDQIFRVRPLHPDCPLRLEQIVTLDGEEE